MENALVRELEKQGIKGARDYVKKFGRPGIGTVERYIQDQQDPITDTGTWRSAPQKIADKLNIPIEILFPEAAEKRQQVLDDLSEKNVTGTEMTLISCVHCPRTWDDKTHLIVVINLTCTHCEYKQSLTDNKLICNHPKAGSI